MHPSHTHQERDRNATRGLIGTPGDHFPREDRGAPRGRPRAVAPLDDGTDVAETAERLLLASVQLDEVQLFVRHMHGESTWRGRLADVKRIGNLFQLQAPSMVVRLSIASVVAVSYCSNAWSSGYCLSDERGAFLTMWSSDFPAFDDWLAALSVPRPIDSVRIGRRADLEVSS